VTEHPSLVGVPTVSYDNEHAGYLAALHLIETGCRRIVFPHPADIFTDPARQDAFPWLVQRLAGTARACERNGGNLVPMGLTTTLHYQEEGEPRANWTAMGAVAAEDIAGWVNTPGRTGIIAPNDWFALGLRCALMARGFPAGPPFRTPEDYSLVGFDNTSEAAEAGVSSIEPPVEILGQRAADLILDMISLRNAAPEVPLLKTEALRSVRIRPTLRPRMTTRGAVGGIGG
jgi:LacI family transcriptional regulator